MNHTATVKEVTRGSGYWWAVCTCRWHSDVSRIPATARDWAVAHMAHHAMTERRVA